MSVGERIIALRKEKGMSQGDLASALDISRQAVSKWENDLSTPDPLKLIKLADILDTDIEYLSTGRKKAQAIRPPIVLETVKTVEKTVEKPVVQVVEKIVEIEKPVIEYVERPVLKKVVRIKYRQNIPEMVIVAFLCFVLGLIIGLFL